jgi:hypothetical protein
MAVLKYLDASTGYVTREDMELLGNDEGPVIAWYPEGAFVYLEDREDGWMKQLLDKGFSTRFCDLIDKAWELDCTIIRLDAGGDVDGLDQEEW